MDKGDCSWTVEKKVIFAVENSMAVHSQMFSPNFFLIHAQTIPEVVNFFFRRGEGAGEISLHEFVSKQLVSKQIGIKMTGFPVTKY